MLVGKGKRGPDLLEARGVLPLAQKPIRFQGRRKRKTARIETRGRRPCEECPPGALIGREAVPRKIPPSRSFEKVGQEPSRVASKGPGFYIFHKHGGILHSWSSFAITARYASLHGL
jgi:hypothetical protein